MLDKVFVMVVELRDAKGSRLSHIGIVVFKRLLQRVHHRLDKLPNVNV